eukprot:scaffold9369_cov62-Phaeocystis_antarctica.AAC.3
MISSSSSSGSARLESPSPPLPLTLNSLIMAALSPSPPPPPPPPPLVLQLASPSQLLELRASTAAFALPWRSFHLRASRRDSASCRASASCCASASRRGLGGVTIGSAGDMYGPRCGTTATGGSSSSSPSMSIRRFSCSSGSSSGRS